MDDLNEEQATYSKLYKDIRETTSATGTTTTAKSVKTQQQKVGRNDDCPCGSGKKFKKCHGKNN